MVTKIAPECRRLVKQGRLGQVENKFWKNLPDIFPKKHPAHHASDVFA